MRNKRSLLESIIQFVTFGIVGLSNTFISYVVYIVLVAANFHYLLASIMGFLISVVNAFYWNEKYVFKAENKAQRVWWKVFLKTFLSYAGTGLILNNILLVVWVDWFEISKVIAPIINLLITVPLNFVMNKYWAFRNNKSTL